MTRGTPPIPALRPSLWALCLLGKLGSGHAEEDIHLTAGLKTWLSNWTSWGVDQTVYNGASFGTISPLDGGASTSVIPQLSLRYGTWLLSTSYMTSTSYDLSSAQPVGPLRNVRASRREVDGNVGYYVIPELAVTVGYKKLDQDVGGTFSWSGPTVGLTGSAPMGLTGLGAYGTLGYGVFRLNAPASSADANGRTQFNASYLNAELGLAYSFRERFTVTLGYRSQTVRTSGYALGSVSLTNPAPAQPYAATQLTDFTQGPTLGLAATLF